MTQLVISLFPGAGLLDKGFELEGFCVVRGPDKLWGSDIRDFHAMPGKFEGVIGGPPCQEISGANWNRDIEKGMELVREFIRVVCEADPEWFLMENVAGIPDIVVPGYSIQRLDLNARECGSNQSRKRYFQFGSKSGLVLIPERKQRNGHPSEPICLASEGKRTDRRDWGDFCELQGLPRDFSLPGLSTAKRYWVVGNGVPIPMAQIMARAILNAQPVYEGVTLCPCGCGRICKGKQISATPACRKRLERRRKTIQV